MARWGDVPFPRNWVEILERVAKVGVFSTAARELGLANTTSYSRNAIDLFDGVKFTADDPIDYLNHLAIKHDIYMAEIDLSGRQQVQFQLRDWNCGDRSCHPSIPLSLSQWDLRGLTLHREDHYISDNNH
mgnify:CR=1 FL=1